MTRRDLFKNIAFVAGLGIAGGLVGFGARVGIGMLNEQHAQLHQCIIAAQHAHPNEDPRAMMAHLDIEVPECMAGAGYGKALDNKNCNIAVWQGEGEVMVIVEDRGVGIPARDIPRLFDRYFRGSNVSGIIGTGVGLYLVKTVVDLHGGEVGVQSREGEGSVFTVRLPDHPPQRADAETQRDERVLIAASEPAPAV